MHQSLIGTILTRVWWNNFLSFNLIYICFFSSSFVCLFPWFWLLSFLRRYVHLLFPNASPSLSSQVLLMVYHALVLLLIFSTFTQGFFWVFFKISCLSIDSYEPVCLFIQIVVYPYSFISVGGCQAVTGFICHPVVSAWGADILWPLYQTVWPFFSLYAVVVTHFDQFFGSCVFLCSIKQAQQSPFAWLSKLIMNTFAYWLIVFWSLVGWKGKTAPFQ